MPRFGRMFSNSPTTGFWETFVADDLTAHIDTRYRTIASKEARGLAGHSMGGYATMRIGMKQPHAFSALARAAVLLAPVHGSVTSPRSGGVRQ